MYWHNYNGMKGAWNTANMKKIFLCNLLIIHSVTVEYISRSTLLRKNSFRYVDEVKLWVQTNWRYLETEKKIILFYVHFKYFMKL